MTGMHLHTIISTHREAIVIKNMLRSRFYMIQKINPIKRTEVVNVRFLPEEILMLKEEAASKGIPLSTYCYLIIKNAINEQMKQA